MRRKQEAMENIGGKKGKEESAGMWSESRVYVETVNRLTGLW